MNPETWPAVDERLERHYRRLLLSYSGHYRRRHGMEMITTMLEMAEPGRSRPSARDAWHLVASGVGQRFRLPAGRPFGWVAAVLVTMVLGVFGAAAGSWLGERTFTELPSRADAVKLLSSAVAGSGGSFIHQYRMSGRADFLGVTLFPSAPRPGGPPAWTVEEARTGLAAAGWTITEFTIHPGVNSVTCGPDERSGETCAFQTRDAAVTAERDGLVLSGTATDWNADESGTAFDGGIHGEMYAERSAAYLPLIVAGALLGGLAGWLLTAALVYRIRSVPPGRGRPAAAVAAIALIIAVPPVWAIVVNMVMFAQHLAAAGPVYAVHAALLPGSHLDGVAAWFIPGCMAVSAAAAVLAMGILVVGTDRKELPGATQPI
ncbi:hypothetical protein [Paractinoplanes durhamensis]|uniref:Uncharacterized protein n=1 Tax=Paractinoplanes durhamensis TaxID=113563 RepID=A0ABQ3ZAV2_9ACTN|nr:hypothetical protein [Actinoplanes durhamensis]GIE06960.1 hypothetical protein Adu01nite_83100 [Actinoplanes durhamensis]